MRHSIVLLPGDGIGPEVVAAARRRARSRRAPIRARAGRSSRIRWAARRSAPGTARAAAGDARCVQGARRRAARAPSAIRRSITCRRPSGPKAGCWRCARGSASTRTCGRRASGRAAKDAGPLKPEVAQRSRSADRPRADRRAVLRRAARHRPRSRRRVQHDALLGAPRSSASRASRSMRRSAGARLVTSVDKANVLETSQLWRAVVTRDRARLSGRHAAAHVRGRVRDGARHRTVTLRRHPDREPVRRHPVGRSGRDLPDRSGCCRRRASATGPGCSSRCTGRRPTSRGVTSPIRSARLHPRRCCSSTVSAPSTRRGRSTRPSTGCSPRGTGRPISPVAVPQVSCSRMADLIAAAVR